MATTIATAWGYDSTRVKEAHRLGSQSAGVQAATRRTFVSAHVNRDGSYSVTVKRDGKVLGMLDGGPE